MAQKLSVQIALEGGKEVERQLADIGDAGQKAFQEISKAAEQAGGFKNLKMADVTAQLKEMGITGADSINQIKQAVQTAGRFETLTQGVVKTEQALTGFKNASEAVAVASGRATAAFGLTRRELGALRTTLRALDLGAIGNQLTAFGRVGGAFGPVGITIAAIGAALGGLVLGFDKFADGAKESVKSLDELAKASGASFESLSSLQIVFAQGGTSAKQFAQDLTNLQEGIREANDGGAALAASMHRSEQATLSVKDAQIAFKEAQARAKSATGELTQGQQKYFEQLRRQMALRQARLRLDRAEQEEREAEANNLDDLVKTFDQISRGAQVAFGPLTKLETKVKAIRTLLAGLSDEDAKAKLADIFQNLSLLDRAQLGKGLGLSPEFIATLSKGSEAIREMQAEVERLGLVLSDLDKAKISELRASQSQLGALWDALKDKMGALVAPAFTSFWQGLTARIQELVPQFLELAETFGKLDFTKIGEAVGDFALKLAKLAVQLGQTFEALAEGDTSGFTKLFDNLANSILQTLNSILNAVLDWAVRTGKEIGSSLLDGIIDAIRNFDLSKLIQIQSLAPNPGEVTSLGERVGKDFGAGFVKGVKSTKFEIKQEDIFGIQFDLNKAIAQWKQLFSGISAAWNKIITPAGAAEAGGGGMDFGPMIAGAEVAAARIKQIFVDAFTPPTTIDFSGLITAAQTAVTDIANAFAQIDIASALAAQIDALVAKFGELARAAAGVTGALAGAGGGGGGGGGGDIGEQAHGGLIGGRGSGTSDSNLAWVSRGEHIMPARAVAQPGVLAFLEALRRSGGNLRNVFDGLGRFALGGLVPRPALAFAGGGRAGSMSHVTINFPGTPPISGLRASAAVVEQLQRAAALAQVRSGGRKPSRYS